MTSARNRCPFTPTQWQELEHQALIFKYMVSGVPIPPELIFSVKRSLDSSLASRLFPDQPIGWGCFQVGFGRKADPEPGRCRRTDGKKWRCSKEAYPDSKYCERHMHRGRNRSRKPVEVNSTATTTTASSTLSPSFPLINKNLSVSTSSNSALPSSSSFTFSPLSSSNMASEIFSHHNPNQTTHLNPFLYSHHSSVSTRSPGSGLSFENDTSPHHFFDDSGTGIAYSQPDKDCSHDGTREGLDERSFFPEASGTVRIVPDSYQPLTVGSYKNYPQSEYDHGFGDSGSKQRQQQQQQEQHCFVLGTDIKSARPMKLEKEDETQKPLHQFFGDWTARNTSTDSWLDLASNSGVHSDI